MFHHNKHIKKSSQIKFKPGINFTLILVILVSMLSIPLETVSAEETASESESRALQYSNKSEIFLDGLTNEKVQTNETIKEEILINRTPAEIKDTLSSYAVDDLQELIDIRFSEGGNPSDLGNTRDKSPLNTYALFSFTGSYPFAVENASQIISRTQSTSNNKFMFSIYWKYDGGGWPNFYYYNIGFTSISNVSHMKIVLNGHAHGIDYSETQCPFLNTSGSLQGTFPAISGNGDGECVYEWSGTTRTVDHFFFVMRGKPQKLGTRHYYGTLEVVEINHNPVYVPPPTGIEDISTWNLSEVKNNVKDIAADLGYQISAISCTQEDCGDPINTRTGAFSFITPDISIPTSAGNLVFQRAYSSSTSSVYSDLLGYGWTHNHDAHLIFSDDPGGMDDYILYKDLNGNQYIFADKGDGSFQSAPGVLSELTRSTSSPYTYTLTTPEKAELSFDESGQLISRENVLGIGFSYTYDADAKLTHVSADNDTRYFDLAYDSQDRIISVTDHTGREISYGYDTAGDLISVVDLNSETWTYVYDSSHRITQALDPNGNQTVRNEYDSEGKVVQQYDGKDDLVVEIVYNSDGTTTVYDADGNFITNQSNEFNAISKITNELNEETNTEYDENFRPVSITNAAGQTLEMEWSEDGVNLLAKTDPAGNRTENTYDELNNLTSITDALGNTTTYSYEGKLLTSETDAEGKTTTYTYTTEGWLASKTDYYNNTTTYNYDSHGQRTSVTDYNGETMAYTYDELGRLTDTTDEQGRVAHNEYNNAGQLLQTIRNYDANRPQNDENVYNITTTYEYDIHGNQIKVTDTLGNITNYEYDDADRLIRTTNAAGNITETVYAENGRLNATIDALGNTTTYVYDATGRLLSTTNALSQSSGTTTFNLSANTTTATDALGNSATYYYDANNREIKVVDALGNFTTTTYNANGNIATRTDQLGRTTTYEYDELNRLISTTNPFGGITQKIYDVNGNLSETIDSLGNRTTYTYNNKGLLTVITDPLGNTITNVYNEEGKLLSTTDKLGRITSNEYDEQGRLSATVDTAGRTTTFVYDILDRVISQTGPEGTISITYDALGRVISRTDVHGRVGNIAYDALGQIISTIDFDGTVNTQTFDANNNLISSTDGLGNTTTYTYDALNRCTAVTDPQGNIIRTVYDALGNVTDEIDANGVVTHYIYDSLNRKTAVIQNYLPAYEATADTNVRIEYTYNAVGNRTQVKDANGNITTFEYNALNQVTKKIDPIGNTWLYEYDLSGNRTTMTDGNGQVTHFSYDVNGQLTLIDYPDPETDVSFSYDAAGQRVTMSDELGTTTWVYDFLGRLTSTTDALGKTVSYTYDVNSNRIGTTYDDGKLVTYTYDNNDQLAEVADWDYQDTTYEYDSLGRLLTILRPNDVDSFYLYDETGQLTQVEHADPEGVLANYQYSYDAVGNIILASENIITGAASGPTVEIQVSDTTGKPLSGINVYAFNGTTYTNYSKTTDEEGKASITLPEGSYHFRADVDGTKFWSGSDNHCEIGKCDQVTFTIPEPVLVSVLDTEGTPQEGLNVYAFDGTTYKNYTGMTNAEGQISLRMPEGNYRFRADFNGTRFWSGTENTCSVPGCTMDEVQVTIPLSVSVVDNMDMPQEGITVYAFDGTTYKNINTVTDDQGQAIFTLPPGDYRFRADYNGTQFWSGAENHCTLPGCTSTEITVNKPFSVLVKDTDGAPMGNINVYVFDGTTYKNFSGTTNSSGEVNFTLPAGNYHFRADYNGTQFWSSSVNHCAVPSCQGANITITKPLTVTVKNTDETVMANLPVYVFTGTTYKSYSAVTNEQGQAVFTLPQGDYRFRADYNGTQFWSGTENHCTLPGCESVDVMVTKPVMVNVLNPDGSTEANVNVYVFDGTIYKNFSALSNEQGQAVFTLPQGDYRFRADYNNVQYWSGTVNHCTLPGCESINLYLGNPTEPTATQTATASQTATETISETPVPSETPLPTATETATQTATPSPTDIPGDTPVPSETPLPTATGTATPTETQQTGALSSGIQMAAYRPYIVQQQTASSILVTVKDSNGTAKEGINIYAFTGSVYTGISGISDVNGTVQFSLPENSEGYRFRADLNGIQFWSGTENHCTLPDCTTVEIIITRPVTVSVMDSDGTAKEGLNVYAFDDATYKNISAITDTNGQAVFTLPQGNYRFRTDLNGTQFWSANENHCALPGCETVDLFVTKPVTVNVADSDGNAKEGLNVYAFDGSTYKNISAVTDVNGQAVFTLPQGNYHFRADLNGTQFWSANENHCALPGCETVNLSVTKPLTVTVAGKSGDPYANLQVYAFNGSTYTGFSGLTNANGQVTFTLPQGSYHFRADYDGVHFWSSNENTCTLPGCEAVTVTLPGGTGERDVTINYEYDALNRLTKAAYDDGTTFEYVYDAAGNVLEYTFTMNDQPVITTYSYDAANQLLTATKGAVIWYYTYDGNGSLIQTTPGESDTADARHYTYNTAGFLTKVERHDGTAWQTQAEMHYDGLGNRLEMIAYADSQNISIQYEMDQGQVIAATSDENSTFYLYGLGNIGQYTDSWSYSLLDGSATPRQMTDADRKVTLYAGYTPWGDTLETYGTGNFTYSYFGGLMDTITGLIYLGNGQYYDPQTGRFLTRGTKTDQTNPYVPWSDPTNAMVAPLVMLSMVFGTKKKRKKLDYVIISLVLIASVGTILAGCGGTPQSQQPTVADVTISPTNTSIAIEGTEVAIIPTTTLVPSNTPEYSCMIILPDILPTSETEIAATIQELVNYIFDNSKHEYIHIEESDVLTSGASRSGVAKYLRWIMDEAGLQKLNTNHLAYIYATTYLESEWHDFQERYDENLKYFDKYEPGTDLGDLLGNKEDNDGYLFRGRGFIHLTGRGNYKNASDNLGQYVNGEPLYVAYPDKAAYGPLTDGYNHITKIAVTGMAQGWFTTFKLSDYDNPDGSYRFTEARAIINWLGAQGGAPADTAAKLGEDFAEILGNHCELGGVSSGITCLNCP